MKVDLEKLKDEDIQSYALVRASLLQKLLRRGMTPEALWVAGLFIKDGHHKGLRRKLYQIAAEDVGLGNPHLLSDLRKEEDLKKMVAMICQSPKNREVNCFHVMTKMNVRYFTDKSESTKNEVRLLWHLLKAAERWVENKRSKENKLAFEKLFNELKDMAPSQRYFIQDCEDTYIELAKSKTFSSEDLLALAVLLATRNPNSVSLGFIDIPEEVPANPVPQFALDRHTPYGKRLGRDWDHWVQEGSVIIPEVTYPSLLDEDGNVRYPMQEILKLFKASK